MGKSPPPRVRDPTEVPANEVDLIPPDLLDKIHSAVSCSEWIRHEADAEEVLRLGLRRGRAKYERSLRHLREEYDKLLAEKKRATRLELFLQTVQVVKGLAGLAICIGPIIGKVLLG